MSKGNVQVSGETATIRIKPNRMQCWLCFPNIQIHLRNNTQIKTKPDLLPLSVPIFSYATLRLHALHQSACKVFSQNSFCSASTNHS